MSGGVKPSVVQTSEDTSDPAEFLLSNSKYHDCHLTVGDASTGEVETIGISSTHLIAHSPVFRHMLAESELADPSGSNTCITDVTPATFKLMLRYVYGANVPKMTSEVALKLAFCADKYNIHRLVRRAAKQLKPTTAENIFPALMCVAYIECPELILEVRKIVQHNTDKILLNPKFLQLDENCILFLVQQSPLNVSELELWNNVVRWGENQVKIQPEKTLRGCLDKALKHLRLLSLKSEEILENVLTKNVLSSDEIVDLTRAVMKKQALQSSGLCKDLNKRDYYKKPIVPDEPTYKFCLTGRGLYVRELENKSFSHITIIPSKKIEINTFKMKSVKYTLKNEDSRNSFNLSCHIHLATSSDGIYMNGNTAIVNTIVVPNQEIKISIFTNRGLKLTLEANKTHNIKIQMIPPLPVHSLYTLDAFNHENDATKTWYSCNDMKLKYEDLFHITEIEYKVLK